jgi:hypothetical protein
MDKSRIEGVAEQGERAGSCLVAGIMEGGVVMERYEGTPQGGPLSPLLANVLLDEVDRELERRGRRFVRYADDCNVYARSRLSGERVTFAVTLGVAMLSPSYTPIRSRRFAPNHNIFGGSSEPFGCFRLILRYAAPIPIHDGKIVLRLRDSLFGGLLEVFRRLYQILRHTASGPIHDGEIVLRLCVALFGGFSEVFDRFCLVPVQSAPVAI